MSFRGTFSPTFDCLIRAGNQGIALGNNSLAAWVKFDNVSAGYEVVEINDSGGQSFASAIILSGNQIEYTQRNAAGTGNADFLGATTVSANTWYHVALTYDGTTLRGYLNGQPNGTHAGITGARGNWADLQIGPTLGEIQDAMFWTRALTADEVAALACARVPKNPQNLRHWLPLFTGSNRLVDYSGNALNFTNSGTPVDGTTVPPVGWGAGRTRVIQTSGTVVTPDGDGRTLFNGSATASIGRAATGDGRTLFNGSGAPDVLAAYFTPQAGLTRFNGSGTAAAAAADTGNGQTAFNGAGTPATAAAEVGNGLTRFNGSGAQAAAVSSVADGRTLFNGSASAQLGLQAAGQTLFNGSATASVAIAGIGAGLTIFNGSASTGALAIGLTLFNGSGLASIAAAESGAGLTAFNGSATASVAVAAAAAGLTLFNGSGTATGGSPANGSRVAVLGSLAGQRRHNVLFGTRRRVR